MKPTLLIILSFSFVLTCLGQSANPLLRSQMEKTRLQADKNPLPKQFKFFNLPTMKRDMADVLLQKMDSLIVVDTFDGQSENYIKDRFIFNIQGLIASYTEAEWDMDMNNWIDSYQSVYHYDAEWNLTDEISYNRSMLNNEWIATSKEEYTYDENNWLQFATGSVYRPDTDSWMLDYQDEYLYTSNTKTFLRSIWDEETQDWSIAYKTEYLYDASEKLLLETAFDWNPVVEIWEKIQKNEYAYNSNGKLETQILSFWYNETQAWVYSQKDQYEYNAEGDLLFHYNYEFEDLPVQWILLYKEEGVYNHQFEYADLLVPDLFENNSLYFNHMLTSISGYDYNEGEWDIFATVRFYYSVIDIISTPENQQSEWIIWPNPASDIVRVERKNPMNQDSEVRLLDEAGRTILSHNLLKGETNCRISLESLSPGLYIIRWKDETEIHTKKLLVH